MVESDRPDGLTMFGALLRDHWVKAERTQKELADRAGLNVRGTPDG